MRIQYYNKWNLLKDHNLRLLPILLRCATSSFVQGVSLAGSNHENQTHLLIGLYFSLSQAHSLKVRPRPSTPHKRS